MKHGVQHRPEQSREREALLAKISELMDYRMLPDLITLGGGTESEQEQLMQGLTDLQVAIYDLDAYLESTWELEQSQLDRWWEPIFAAMQSLGYSREKASDLVSYIEKYQVHESQLREGKMPTRLSMEYFYFYKSCDVKLLRRIIYDRYPKLNAYCKLSDWRAFDLITEVDDDVEDVFEDGESINGNRFLISLYQNGVSTTILEFKQLLDDAHVMISERFGADAALPNARLEMLCLGELAKTQSLLLDRTAHVLEAGLPAIHTQIKAQL